MPAARTPARFSAAPGWAMLSIAAGGAAAIAMVPADGLFAPQSLWAPALAQAAGLLGGVAVAALRSPASLLRAEHVLSFGVFYWLLLDLLLGQGGVGQASSGAVVRAFAAITVFTLGLWCGSVFVSLYSRSSNRPATLPSQDLGARFLFWAAVISACLGSARVLVGCRLSLSCIAEALYQPRFSAAWFQVDTFGHLDTLFLYSRYFGFLVLPLAVAFIRKERRISSRGLLVLALGTVCILLMIADGGRKDVGTTVGAAVIVWVAMQRRLSLRQIAGVAAVGAALVVVMQFMLVARNAGIGAALEAESIDLDRAAPVGTVDRNFRYLANITQLVPERFPHNGWQGIAFAATLWVPGRLVPWEWQRRSVDVPREMGINYGLGYTWTCSAIGDLYLIGGLAAVLAGGFLFGVAARVLSGMLLAAGTARVPLLYALMTMTLFLSLRALHELFVTGFIVAAFLSLLAVRAVLRGPAP